MEEELERAKKEYEEKQRKKKEKESKSAKDSDKTKDDEGKDAKKDEDKDDPKPDSKVYLYLDNHRIRSLLIGLCRIRQTRKHHQNRMKGQEYSHYKGPYVLLFQMIAT